MPRQKCSSVHAATAMSRLPPLRIPPHGPGDDLLLRWRKLDKPAVALPPHAALTGWRDPFVYSGALSAAAEADGAAGSLSQQQQAGQQAQSAYCMLLGSGVKGKGGALLAYSSDGGGGDGASGSSLAEGWQYDGALCSAEDLLQAAAAAGQAGGAAADPAARAAAAADAAAAHELGEVWECPLLAQLPPLDPCSTEPPGERRWLLAVSPYPVQPPHTPSNPVLCWIGQLGSRQAGRRSFHQTQHGRGRQG